MAGGDYSIDEPVRFAVNPLAGSAMRINVDIAEKHHSPPIVQTDITEGHNMTLIHNGELRRA